MKKGTITLYSNYFDTNSFKLGYLYFINPLTILLDSNGLNMVTRYAMSDKTNKIINIYFVLFYAKSHICINAGYCSKALDF